MNKQISEREQNVRSAQKQNDAKNWSHKIVFTHRPTIESMCMCRSLCCVCVCVNCSGIFPLELLLFTTKWYALKPRHIYNERDRRQIDHFSHFFFCATLCHLFVRHTHTTIHLTPHRSWFSVLIINNILFKRRVQALQHQLFSVNFNSLSRNKNTMRYLCTKTVWLRDSKLITA